MSSEDQPAVEIAPPRKKLVPKKSAKKHSTPTKKVVRHDVMHDGDNNNTSVPVQEDTVPQDAPIYDTQSSAVESSSVNDSDAMKDEEPVVVAVPKKKASAKKAIRVINDDPKPKKDEDYTDLAPVGKYTIQPDSEDLAYVDPNAAAHLDTPVIYEDYEQTTNIYQEDSSDGFRQLDIEDTRIDTTYEESLREYYNEQNGTTASEATSSVYVCTDHQTLGNSPLNPASVIFAPNEESAIRALDAELARHGLAPFEEHKYTLTEVNMTTPRAYILSLLATASDNQYKHFAQEQDYEDDDPLSLFICRSHWSAFPYPGISIVVAPNKIAATNILDNALIAAGGKPSTVHPYELDPTNHDRDDIGAIILSSGEVSTYQPR
jgi:hypothetical protein